MSTKFAGHYSLELMAKIWVLSIREDFFFKDSVTMVFFRKNLSGVSVFCQTELITLGLNEFRANKKVKRYYNVAIFHWKHIAIEMWKYYIELSVSAT